MDFRSIMAIVDGGAESSTVLTTAIELGKRFDAVTALVQINPPAAFSIYPVLEASVSGAVGEMIGDMERAITDRQKNFDTLYQKAVVSAGMPVIAPDDVSRTAHFAVTRETVIGHENREIAERGRLFDLIVIGVPGADSGGVDSAALEAALLDTARPVLITCRYPRPVIGGHVTIAWDGSREAAQSIRNALPLMLNANKVEVVHVTGGHGASKIDPNDIVKYLQLHDIKSESRVIEAKAGKVAEALLEAARLNGHALLVMGAYGTSAVTEFMFGGVTRSVMSNADVPLLVSH
jgi:nucleotide-binding universal stress UspA family protein